MSGSIAVRFEVVNANVLDFRTDVLVLKWAQAGHGADAAAFSELQAQGAVSDWAEMPADGLYRTFRGSGQGPQHFLFVGTPPLRDFDYNDVRSFSRRALVALMVEFPKARRVALTLHGPGVGLDEFACFEEELRGLLDGISLREAPAGLEEIVFVERNRGRAERMEVFLREFLGETSAGRRDVTPDEAASISGERDRPGLALADRPTAFVAMPFAEDFEDTYNLGIQPVLHELGFKCERIDQVAFVGDVIAEIRNRIRSAVVVVADLTGANPNVYLEVGFAWACEVPTVLLARDIGDIKSSLRFDVQSQRCLVYKNITRLREQLHSEVSSLRLVSPRA